MKRFILWAIALGCIAIPGCKKETITFNGQEQPSTQQVANNLAQALNEASLRFSSKAPAHQRLQNPVNTTNPLDFVGSRHNQKIKEIIALAPENPSVEAIFNAYQESPLIFEGEQQVIGNLETYIHYIEQGKELLYRVEGGRVSIDPQAYEATHFSGMTNAVLRQFFELLGPIADYNLRRVLSITAEEFVATAPIDDVSKAQILGTISLFKWSDHFWNNEYDGPLDMAKPSPAFWDVLWVKFTGPDCDAMGPGIPGINCWNDVINGSSAISSLFLNLNCV